MTSPGVFHNWRLTRQLSLCWLAMPLVLAGCITPPFGWGSKPADNTPTASDAMVIGVNGTKPEEVGPDAVVYAELARAKEMLKANDWAAEKIFAKLAKNKKNPTKVMAEARYLEAVCQAKQNYLSKAEATFKLLLKEHNKSQYATDAAKWLFDIANYWLNDTRKQMELYEQKRAGKIWWVPPSFVHWSKDKPFLDEEGRALLCLEAVYEADVGTGPLKEQAMFYLGTVHFFRENYRDADHWYSLLYRNDVYKKRELAPKAMKQAIICKQLVNGGSAYDRRTLEQARQLVEEFRITFRDQAEKENDWLNRQLVNINHQQADGDFNTAEFYKRVGKPGSAYFYYELVRRRYPGTNYAKMSVARMDELRDKAAKEQSILDKADEDLRNTPARQPETLMSRLFNWRRSDTAVPQQQPPPEQAIVPVSMPGDPVQR